MVNKGELALAEAAAAARADAARVEELISSCRRVEEGLWGEGERAKAEVRERVEHLSGAVRRRGEELVGEIEGIVRGRVAVVRDHSTTAAIELGRLRAALRSCNFEESPQPLKPIEEQFLKLDLECGAGLEEGIGRWGNVKVGHPPPKAEHDMEDDFVLCCDGGDVQEDDNEEQEEEDEVVGVEVDDLTHWLLNRATTPQQTATKFIDFPCLRLDPKCWLHGEKSGEYEIIIPPAYALPFPFWLKK